MDYGSLKGHKKLPRAAILGLEKAADLIKTGVTTKMAWASASRFGSTLEEINEEKFEVLAQKGLTEANVLAMVECTNSITEAERILAEAPNASRLIVICDWRHARRTYKMWRHFFKGDLIVLTTNAVWNEDHPSFWCRSNLRWLVGNIIHHTLLLLRGVDSLRDVVHPVKK